MFFRQSPSLMSRSVWIGVHAYIPTTCMPTDMRIYRVRISRISLRIHVHTHAEQNMYTTKILQRALAVRSCLNACKHITFLHSCATQAIESPREVLPELPGLSEHDELMRRETARRFAHGLVCMCAWVSAGQYLMIYFRAHSFPGPICLRASQPYCVRWETTVV